jgi:RimJ/RimL family protein N-acetyltransferase
VHLLTERLVLTPFDRERDWASIVEDLVLDPIVTRYWTDFADPDLTADDRERLAADEFLPWFEAGRARGLVAWVLRTPDEAFVGVSGLMIAGPPMGDTDPEFGCMLATRWHGQGLATEAGSAVLEDAWQRLRLARVITVMDSPNPASRLLVDKLGFTFDGVEFDDSGCPLVRFVIDRPAHGQASDAAARPAPRSRP